ncbi:ABC transporter substrate-binding protein [Conexibacter stalactiti]|uniref:ABC transporter substrate-binding protein n=1 Tax=Conexibacter stalactiti TaxID=1940611 RepID=A0ABU4HYB8_9ACTN|nr:ABC transporter substrate-binding protein [Conexibacter stalactiti]MDW5598298.1 ABC transporter substrate-binding protein [Conexibacter stalactiti]MEC5038940.1 ABC transporter substrate-binding protein [Conexibacter stalactiti]
MAEIRVGVHPSNPSLFALRRKGILEALLAPLDATVAWVDYASGLTTLELIAEDKIDVSGTGATPPISSQANGVDVVYIAASEPRPAHGKLVVRNDDEQVTSVADLKGRKVALAHGSYQTILLAVALDQAGLTFDDVTRVDTAAEDAKSDSARGRELLEAGEVDAWIGGDPDLLAAEQAGSVRPLVDTDAVMSNRSVWFGRRDFAQRSPELLEAFVAALVEVDRWIAEQPREAAELFAEHAPGAKSAEQWEAALTRRPWGPKPISDAFAEEQQRAADLLARQGIIARTVDVRAAVVEPAAALAVA